MQKPPFILDDRRHGTQVLYQWALWQRNHAPDRHIRTAIFRKEQWRLVVYEYRASLCGVLKLANVKPKLREFRAWREPFATVHTKLAARGWLLVSDNGE